MVAAPDFLTPKRMTIEEWADMDEDEPGEFVDGQVVEDEVPNEEHEAVVGWLFFRLKLWAEPRAAMVFGSELKFAVSSTRGRKPDLSMYLHGKYPRKGKSSLARHAPRLMVEIITPTARDIRRDRVEKLAEYAQFGARSYWIVDRVQRTFDCYDLADDGKYSLTLSASTGQVTVPGFHALVLDLDDLWREVNHISEIFAEEPEDESSES